MGLDISSKCSKRSETPEKAGRETEVSGGAPVESIFPEPTWSRFKSANSWGDGGTGGRQ